MNLNSFFEPSSITIVGASRKEGSLGRVFFDSLLHYNYKGKIYPVNPKASEISGIRCYPNVQDIPEVPNLAVILVRKDLAMEAVKVCGEKGIENIIMITAGFREIGGEGIEREEQLMKIVRKYNMKMIGPNCMGVINTDPGISMNASFSPTEPFTGNVAFVSQSGALGVAVLEMCKALRLGFSIFVSVGNKADLTDNDFLEYLENHKNTDVITLYQESIEDSERFRKITSQISKKKPIIALKAGRSKSGARAATSHTGALASSDLATDALFKQCGILRANSVEELFELSLAFSYQPIPENNRVAVITNAGGPAILATDAIEKYGLEMASLSHKTQAKLKSFLPEEAAVGNPVDMIASANEKTYRDSLEMVLEDKGVDSVIVIIVRPPVNTTPKMIAESFKDLLSNGNNKPVFVVLMAHHDEQCGLEVFQNSGLPVYAYPEAAARSIAKMLTYQKRKSRPKGTVKKFPVNRGNLNHIFESVKGEDGGYLSSEDVQTILRAYDYPIPFSSVVQSPEEAITIFEKIHKPIVMKVDSEEIIHKSDIGGIRTNLAGEQNIIAAYNKIMENALKITTADNINGIFVQEMVTGDHEVSLGMNRDPNHGPMIMFGLGGILIEILRDVSFRIAPITDQDAREMIEEIQAYPILQGIRGQKKVETDVIVETIQKLSQLSLDFPQIVEMDINPFIISAEKENCKIVDARIKISPNK